MADNYTEFSEELQILNAEERTWLESQLELVFVYEGNEYPEDQVPPELQNQDPEYRGYRFLRDCPDVDGDSADTLGFEYELIESSESGCTLWLYSESWGRCDHVAHLVQRFLKEFRPQDCWSLSYSASCSKPRMCAGAIRTSFFVTSERRLKTVVPPSRQMVRSALSSSACLAAACKTYSPPNRDDR
jgi:hypothetical protein